MDKEQTERAIEVMQAWVDGRAIECMGGDIEWLPASTPIWDWRNFNYRIKPKPRDIWVNEYNGPTSFGNRGIAYNSEDHARAGARQEAERTAVHYREVIE